MELLYSVNRKSIPKQQVYTDFMDMDEELKGLIRISQTNIVAWVTRYNLNKPGDLSLGSRVYIADANMPWNYWMITTNDNIVTLLEWDLPGERLLIGDDSGTIAIWSYNDYIFNDWICVFTTNFIGECMTAGIFFHLGRKISLNEEHKGAVQYYDRFTFTKYQPSVRMAGGTALDGCLCVTSTGLLVACLMVDLSPSSMLTLTDSLSTTRHKIAVVDIAYGRRGNLIVATSCSNYKMPVRCYEVKITYLNRKRCRIVSQALAGFFVNGIATHAEVEHSKISHLKFAVQDVAEVLIVVINGTEGSQIQLWVLCDKGQSQLVHVLPDDKPGPATPVVPKPLGSLRWEQRKIVILDSPVESVSPTKSVMYESAPSYVIFALKNSVIVVLSSIDLQEEFIFDMDSYWETKETKKVFSNIYIADIDMSWLGNALVALDNVGNFYLFQLQTLAELKGPMTVDYAVAQLEYCLISGNDFWDIAVQLKSAMLETVCDQLTENFLKQPASVQQLEYDGFLSMKASLYRMSTENTHKHDDLLFLLSLHSISVAFKSLLRPTELMYSDKVPGDSLSAVLSDTVTDVNSVIVNIEPKEFTVEQSTLQSLQQLIQWVANLALNILGRIPEHRKGTGYDIVTDNQALNIIREMLVIIRIWGLLRPSCMPVFVRNVNNFDGLSTIFRLISKLMQCNTSNEMDETLIGDCQLLRNHVMIPDLSSAAYESNDIASPNFYYQTWPLCLQFGVEPELSRNPECLLDDRQMGGTYGSPNTDIIRHVYLGQVNGLAGDMKQCNRCDGKTQTITACKSAALRSWQNRWLRACLCGGKWRFIRTNRHQPYSSPAMSAATSSILDSI